MRAFNYKDIPQDLFSSEIMGLVSSIHEFKGKQDLYIQANKDILSTLMLVAQVQSTDASNRIEGIFTSNRRLKDLVAKKAVPRNRNEEEIAGYRDVLATIHENYDHIQVTPNIILQLHRDMYQYSSKSFGGQWKIGDNRIVEIDRSNNEIVRFDPLTALETPLGMDALCSAFRAAIESETHHPLLLILMFVFDFTCIHPFNDGNGRMSRFLTLLLLYRSGYLVGKYISIEAHIEKTKDSYYDALRCSSEGWHANTNAYLPFVQYMLGVILGSYKDLAERVEDLSVGVIAKSERVRLVFERSLGKVTKAEILMQCPDISTSTVERTLADLLAEGYITKVGAGPSTGYVKA